MMDRPSVARLTHPKHIDVGLGAAARTLAYRQRQGSEARSGVVWLGGFRSDMLATKAEALDGFCEANQRCFVRFDYSGHGESSGDFRDGTISRWLEDARAIVDATTHGAQILVGSSMGGWLALLLARDLAAAGRSLAGLVLIAPAVDFTEALLWKGLDAEARHTIEAEGVYLRPSAYAPEPVPITRGLIEDGRRHLLLGGVIRSHAPVHILQGMLDADVPWRHAMTLVEHFAADPVVVTLIKDGDHRLSRPQDIKRLIAAVEGIA